MILSCLRPYMINHAYYYSVIARIPWNSESLLVYQGHCTGLCSVPFLPRLQYAGVARTCTMKLPFPQDDHNKRMTATPDTGVPRDLLYELRETSLLGNSNVRLMIDKATQSSPDDMELNDYNGGPGYSPPVREVEPSVGAEWSPSALNETIPIHVRVESTDHVIKAWQKEMADVSSSSEPQQKPVAPVQPPTSDDGPRCKLNNSSSLDTPDADQHENYTSTLRIRDRSRYSSGSEDDIEKISENVLDVSATDETKPLRADRNPDASRESDRTRSMKDDPPGQHSDDESDCAIQCLAYTLQCCECVIS